MTAFRSIESHCYRPGATRRAQEQFPQKDLQERLVMLALLLMTSLEEALTCSQPSDNFWRPSDPDYVNVACTSLLPYKFCTTTPHLRGACGNAQ